MSGKDGRRAYLGKHGKVFGPFPMEKIEQMRLSGELFEYTYLWEEGGGEWKNIDPMPPKPGATSTRRRGDSQLESTDAICHDHNALVAGKLQNVTDSGCELVSPDPSGAPRLALNTPLVLNVMDEKSQKAMNIRAAVYEISHQEGTWIYHLRWAHRPSI